ncbi:MAG TPA: hypothetical protein VEQ65_07570, partial [Opitutus sp.]|nr:hypothetical protein [Opitutus sp.]
MNVLVHIVTLLATMSAFVVGGYWLAGRLVSISPAQRLATASLVGLAAVLWSLSVVNLFRGIDGWSAVLCMWPLAVTLASTRWRSMLWKDLKATVRRREGRVGALVGCAFLALLTSPELSRTDSLYFDATPNHDGYFWITGAKHLQDHSYLEFRLMDRDRPWANSTSAYGGWRPVWGRTGAEGLIALVATLTRSDPIG